jgi:tetrahydromethanopterin S-methyltransferase subunit G
MKLVPTQEQTIACQVVKDNQRVKLNAYAGCSKTTTLSMVAHDLCAPSLYLAYNKSMAVEAREKFPEWVRVSTTHALAYAIYGRQLATKLKRPQGAYQNVCGTGGEIARYFKIKGIFLTCGESITANGIGLAIRETVNRFEYSADKKITAAHVSPAGIKKVKGKLDQIEQMVYIDLVKKHAEMLWALRCNLNSNILATHDTYLKQYQLSEPDLSSYDVLYLDEGQDTNECVLDIVMRQTKPKIVVVGDEFQQIYQWRGSVNAMGKLPFVESKLSQSFRFGQAIADLANVVLSQGDVKTNIRGWEQCESTVAYHYDQKSMEGCYTLLYRTNMMLVLDAVELISRGKRVNLEIDVSDFVKLLESGVELKMGNMKGVKHEEMLPYENWSDFAKEVQGTGGELGRVYQIIDGGRVYEVLGMLRMQRNTDDPEIILTTAHKSKGREWDVVWLASDFPSNWNNKGEWVGLRDEERNLLYVAVTRARKHLIYNDTVKELLDREPTTADVEEAYKAELGKHLRGLNPDYYDLM